MKGLIEKLIEHRKALGLNQEDFAGKLEIGFRTYQTIESTKSVKSGQDLYAIIKELGLDTQIFSHGTVDLRLEKNREPSISDIRIALEVLTATVKKMENFGTKLSSDALEKSSSPFLGLKTDAPEDLESLGKSGKRSVSKSGKRKGSVGG